MEPCFGGMSSLGPFTWCPAVRPRTASEVVVVEVEVVTTGEVVEGSGGGNERGRGGGGVCLYSSW